MALILDTDLLCIERGGRSYKWTGAELKGQVTNLAPIASVTPIDPIVIEQFDRDYEISIKDASTIQKGAVILTNTVDNSEDKALTPKGAKDVFDTKADLDGSNATGTWDIDISGNAATATHSETADNATNSDTAGVATQVDLVVDNDNANRSVTFASATSGPDQLRTSAGITYNPSANSLTVGGNIIAGSDLISNSDENLKLDIEPIQGALKALKEINGVSFTWKNTNKRSMGVIAQDVEKVFPDIVSKNGEHKALVYHGIIGALVEAVKELSQRVEELEQKSK